MKAPATRSSSYSASELARSKVVFPYKSSQAINTGAQNKGMLVADLLSSLVYMVWNCSTPPRVLYETFQLCEVCLSQAALHDTNKLPT